VESLPYSVKKFLQCAHCAFIRSDTRFYRTRFVSTVVPYQRGLLKCPAVQSLQRARCLRAHVYIGKKNYDFTFENPSCSSSYTLIIRELYAFLPVWVVKKALFYTLLLVHEFYYTLFHAQHTPIKYNKCPISFIKFFSI
jgi:hypothetical protein